MSSAPYVEAVVVRVERPSSVHAGDHARVHPDGRIEGFVGGACTETAVRLHAARVLETGEPLLLRVAPGDEGSPAQDGTVTVHNPCLSGGSLEIFLEPRLPRPRVVVAGDSPTARAFAALAGAAGYEVADGEPGEGDLAVVVASHGRDEEEPLRRALEHGVPYAGLVASRRRGAAVLERLRSDGVPEERLARVHTPAGLDIGAREPEEIAVAILAEIVQARRAAATMPVVVHPSAAAPAERTAAAEPAVPAADPVCGMTVGDPARAPATEHEGRRVVFCCEGCRRAFLQDPARYAVAG